MKSLILLLIIAISIAGCFQDTPKEIENKSSTESQTESTLTWQPFTEAALKENLGKKPIIIYFWAEWCAPCHQMRRLTFVNAEVTAKIKDFALFKIDATDQDSPEFMKLQDKYEVDSLPVVIFYNAKGDLKKALTLTGFEPPLDFIRRLERL